MKPAGLGLVVVATLWVGALPATAVQTDPATAGWIEILDRALEATHTVSFEGRVVIVSFDEHGPSIAELDVAQDPGGELRVGSGETWMVARLDTEAVLLRAGSLLRLSRSDETGFDPERVVDKYTVEVGELIGLDTGPATMLQLRERRGDLVRERLYVDENTGLVVRRETLHADGTPQRLVAFTDLRTSIRRFETMPGEEELRGVSQRISGEGIDILDEVGWVAPHVLPGEYRLQAAYALPESEGSSLHLVYGDGLYTISIYQQQGSLQADALDGAVADAGEGMHHYTWPGAEPTRMVWSGEDLTFTAVTDAPTEHVTAAVEAFPHESPPSLPRRMVRGLRRVADMLWPFA